MLPGPQVRLQRVETSNASRPVRFGGAGVCEVGNSLPSDRLPLPGLG
jgi:hypothetical protein